MLPTLTPSLDPQYSVTVDTTRVLSKVTCERQPMARLLDNAMSATSVITLDADDQQTQVAGMQKRLLRKLPAPDPDLLNRLKKFVRKFVKRNLKPLSEEPDFEEWLTNGDWTLAQQEQMRKHWEEVMRRELPPVKVCGTVKPFIKRESYPEFKHARWINASNLKFKLVSGRWFSAIEDRVYGVHGHEGLRNPAGQPWFIKHVPVEDRPTLISQLESFGSRYLNSDFTSFEASFTEPVMSALELVLYRHMLSGFPAIRNLICDTLRGTRAGVTRAGVKFSRPAGRMSGDSCTSLGNGFSNLMLWLFWAEIHGTTVTGYVEGDDGLFATNAQQNPQDTMIQLGFDVKCEDFDHPTEASFCGIVCSRSLEIVRDPFVVLHKFPWSLTNPRANRKKCKELLCAKALSLRCEAPQCPILRELAEWALRRTEGVKPRWEVDHYHSRPMVTDAKVFNPAVQTRTVFTKKYGVSVDQQLHIEDCLRSGDMSWLETFLLQNPNSDSREAHLFARFMLRAGG